ncbi:hypothetical protein DFH09DRAFT_1444736 [Mycena vulgaris]|nr:hypothetical protein DFH09DRAFT_1444736 [Mycena vulgaris]
MATTMRRPVDLAPPSHAAQRKQHLLQLENEQRIEDAEALKMTEFEWSDLDGMRPVRLRYNSPPRLQLYLQAQFHTQAQLHPRRTPINALSSPRPRRCRFRRSNRKLPPSQSSPTRASRPSVSGTLLPPPCSSPQTPTQTHSETKMDPETKKARSPVTDLFAFPANSGSQTEQESLVAQCRSNLLRLWAFFVFRPAPLGILRKLERKLRTATTLLVIPQSDCALLISISDGWACGSLDYIPYRRGIFSSNVLILILNSGAKRTSLTAREPERRVFCFPYQSSAWVRSFKSDSSAHRLPISPPRTYMELVSRKFIRGCLKAKNDLWLQLLVLRDSNPRRAHSLFEICLIMGVLGVPTDHTSLNSSLNTKDSPPSYPTFFPEYVRSGLGGFEPPPGTYKYSAIIRVPGAPEDLPTLQHTLHQIVSERAEKNGIKKSKGYHRS